MKKVVFLVLLLFVVFSCEKYLDAPQPTDFVSKGEYKNNIKSHLAGIYRALRSRGYARSRTDAIGYSSVINSRNLSGNDVIRGFIHWYIHEYRHTVKTIPNARKTIHLWGMFYNLIDQTNVIIENVEDANLKDEEKDAVAAEARALRAFFYFELMQEFASPYLEGAHADKPGVPIYETSTKFTSPEDIKPKSRATVGEVYDFIISDLKYALDVGRDKKNKTNRISENRVNKSALNRSVIQGLLARVYLHHGNWSKAAELARDAKNGYTLDAASYLDGFIDINAAEWMWGCFQTDDQNLGFAGFHAFWHPDAGRYPPFTINKSLVDLYSSSDVRYETIAGLASGDFGPDGHNFFSSKFSYSSNFDEDIPLMRVAEMYLIEAEGLARSGNESGARQILYQLQSNRDPNAQSIDRVSGERLINMILTERRKELYGEGLADYSDIRRLGLPLRRDGAHPVSERYFFRAGHPCFTYQIPHREMDYNPHMEQNPLCVLP